LRTEPTARMDKTIFSAEYEVFLRRLRQARRVAGLTQAEVAGRLGQTQSFVGKGERCERRPDIVEARASCLATGVPSRSFQPGSRR